MSIWHGFIMGIIQGLSEFLPVSSSGHLSLYQYFTGNNGAGSTFFSLMLHLGTLAAVIAAYYEDLWAMLKQVGQICRELFSGSFRFGTTNPHRKMLYMLFFACLPMFLILPLHGWVSGISEDRDIIIEGVCFLITAALLFAACKAKPGRAGIRRMKPLHAGIIGLFQAAATMPGISRSGATIAAGMVLGFDRAMMVKFSFLLGIPAILGGVVFELSDAMAEGAKLELWPLFVGMLTAAVVGYVAIRLIRYLVLSNKFIVFAWYTLVLGVVVVALGLVGRLTGWPAAPAGALDGVRQLVAAVASGAGGGSASLPPA